jgi:hypothetical protein
VPQVRIAKAFRRHVECPDATVDGSTVRDALDGYFRAHPAVRSYVLDEHGAVRQHVTVFVDDEQIVDRAEQSDPVGERGVISVFQALSGG